eukprot:TRINITY_DN1672_c0_g1_i1.p1 TRINITY_DN1672_c0_g1~~TRINITY_DN1672_c0_g1_i1.p1  ORF type:complete len:70 (+),score=12.30 TRINITY_DN1672_c0_g1_i1:278-487(+)
MEMKLEQQQQTGVQEEEEAYDIMDSVGFGVCIDSNKLRRIQAPAQESVVLSSPPVHDQIKQTCSPDKIF